tara:strand:- start:7879 stop:8067 length:189 start_codon:yes stop_codon:yes gene_type:complete
VHRARPANNGPETGQGVFSEPRLHGPGKRKQNTLRALADYDSLREIDINAFDVGLKFFAFEV